MTKYLVFKNKPESGLFNVPGSREEMACDIAILTTGAALSKDFYIAYSTDSPNSSMEILKESPKFAVVIDDKRADLWVKEIVQMSRLSDEIDEHLDFIRDCQLYHESIRFDEHLHEIEVENLA